MNFKEKINKLNVDAMSADEIYALWGTTEKEQDEKTAQLLRRMNFKAKAEQKRIKNQRISQLRIVVKQEGNPKVQQLRSTLQTRFAVNFRNLDQMSDEQLAHIAEDLEILELLESENEQSK